MLDNDLILDADKEIGAIQADLAAEEAKKTKKKGKEPKKGPAWMDKYRGNRYFHRFWEFLSTKWAVLRSNWLNLAGFAAIFTNILSIFTIAMMALAMYYSVDHLKKGGDFKVIIAGAILIVAIGWVNSRIDNDSSANEEDISQ